MSAHSASAAKRNREQTRRLAQYTINLSQDCQTAYHAFDELPELAENLRVLSLNAEFAAGRAGEKGRAVRVLTQYTRELVSRLAQITADMYRLKNRTYKNLAGILRRQRELLLVERSILMVESSRGGEFQHDTREIVTNAWQARLKSTADIVRDMSTGFAGLGNIANLVAEVGSQADSIATNIAIEAASAGQFEGEFKNVANTMRNYVLQLRNMTEQAGKAVRGTSEKSEALLRLSLRYIDRHRN